MAWLPSFAVEPFFRNFPDLSSPANASDSEREGAHSGSVWATQVIDTVTVAPTWVPFPRGVHTRLSLPLKTHGPARRE